MSFFYHLKELLHVSRYTRKRLYRVSYSITIACPVSSGTVSVCVPLPQETAFQKRRNLAFSQPITLLRDEVYGNEYGVWDVTTSSGGDHTLVVSAEVAVQPKRVSLKSVKGRPEYSAASARHLTANEYIDPTNPEIVTIAESLNKKQDFREMVASCNETVISRLVYGDPIDGLYSTQDVFSKSRVDCGGFDAFFCSLCIALGIPAVIVSGFWAEGATNAMHAWCEVLRQDGAWIPADPSIEYLVRAGKDRTKSGRLGYVGSDRIVFGIGCDISVTNGRGDQKHIPLLQHPSLITGQASATIKFSFSSQCV